MRPIVITLQIAFTYVGTVVGAGFATGREILQFFTQYGPRGIWGILLAIPLLGFFGSRMMVLGSRLRTPTYVLFNQKLFGPFWGRWINLFMTLSLLGVTVAMLAGAGSIFQENLQLPFLLGIAITSVVTYLITRGGIQGVMDANTAVVPLMLLFNVAICFLTLWLTWKPLALASSWPQADLRIPDWLRISFTYAAFNVTMSQVVLVPLGHTVREERLLVMGGWLGALLIGSMLVMGHIILSQHMPEVARYEVPMGQIVAILGLWMQGIFLFVVWSEILTTLVGNITGLSESLQRRTSLNPFWSIWILLLLCGAFSLYGFSRLVGLLYPLIGYIGWAVLLALLVPRRS